LREEKEKKAREDEEARKFIKDSSTVYELNYR
jgi:hypothetical protein